MYFPKTVTAGFVHKMMFSPQNPNCSCSLLFLRFLRSFGQTLIAILLVVYPRSPNNTSIYILIVALIFPWLIKSPIFWRNPTRRTISQISCSLGPLGPLGPMGPLGPLSPLVSEVICDCGVKGSVLVFQMDLGRLPLDFGLA